MQNRIAPKLRFIADAASADAFMETVMSPQFKAGAEAALLEYALNCPTGANQLDAMRAAYQIEGAKQFLRVLLTLGESTPSNVDPKNQELEPV